MRLFTWHLFFCTWVKKKKKKKKKPASGASDHDNSANIAAYSVPFIITVLGLSIFKLTASQYGKTQKSVLKDKFTFGKKAFGVHLVEKK